MRIGESSPPPLSLLLTGGEKRFWRLSVGDSATSIWVLCANQNSGSQDRSRVIVCDSLVSVGHRIVNKFTVRSSFVSVCSMNSLSQCLDGPLLEAVAVSQMITSAFSSMLGGSPHLSLLFYSFLIHPLPFHRVGRKPFGVTDRLLEQRLFRFLLTLEHKNTAQKCLGHFLGSADWVF